MFSKLYLSTAMDEVHVRTRKALALLRSAQEIAPGLAGAAEATRQNVERRLTSTVVTAAVVGEPLLRYALFDHVLGAPVFGGHGSDAHRTTRRLAYGTGLEYVAILRDGTIERFTHRSPDRGGAFAEALARSELDRDQAAEALRARTVAPPGPAGSGPAAASSASTPVVEPIRSEGPSGRPTRGLRAVGRRLWAWVLALVARMLGREPSTPVLPEPSPAPALEAAPPPPSADGETPIATATAEQARLAAITAEVEQVRTLRDRYAAERCASFLKELRALADPDGRGAEVADLRVEIPSPALGPGMVLLDLPDLGRQDEAGARAYDIVVKEADGCLLLVSPGGQVPAMVVDVLEPVRPHVVTDLPGDEELRALCDRVRQERPLLLAARALAGARQFALAASERTAQTEAAYRQKMAALEAFQVEDAAEFRAGFLTRMDNAIDQSIEEVLKSAVARLGEQIGAARAEWTTAIQTADTRAAIDDEVRAINQGAPTRLADIVTNISEHMTSEMQRASDTMQLWVREEMKARTQLVHRHWPADDSAAVLSAITSDDFESLPVPLAGAIDDFEHRRVGYGVGGAAAGALLGTLLVPGIGTAIGAFVGTFAGLLKRTDSLKSDCVARLERCLADAEGRVRREIEARRPELASAVRGSLQDAMQAALERFDQQMAHLLDLERKILADVQTRRGRLDDLCAAIDAHVARVAALADGVRAVVEGG